MASNRPAPQAPRATSQDTQGFPAMYSNADGLRPAAPAGQAGVEAGWSDWQHAALPDQRFAPHPQAASHPSYPSHSSYPAQTAQSIPDAYAPHPPHSAPAYPTASGPFAAASATPPQQSARWTRVPSETTSRGHGGLFDDGWSSAAATGEWDLSQTAGDWRQPAGARQLADTGEWDTADSTAEWDFHEIADEPAAAEAENRAWQGTTGAWRDESSPSARDADEDAGPRGSGPGEEWNPTADSVRPLRGKHRVMKQRGGLARSSTVLGVGVIAAVGAGGIATAQGGKPPVHISVPDLSSVTGKLPEAASIPVVGHLLSGGSGTSAAPLTGAGITADDAKHGTTDAGEALRERILQQAEQQQEQAADTVAETAENTAVHKAAEQADQQKDQADAKAAEAKKKAEAEAKRKAEAARLAELAKSFTLPVVSYTITSHFGDAGSMWSSGYHTGLDFAAPTGTPIKAIHSATVKEAGWSGSYGYRTVLELDDGTELWYCHQSSIGVSVGQKVTTGQVVGRVGATGNVTGPHLHLEVHLNGGAASDPMPWLLGNGLTP